MDINVKKVEAYQCSVTGRLFLSKEEAVECLSKLTAEDLTNQKKRIIETRRKELSKIFRHTLNDITKASELIHDLYLKYAGINADIELKLGNLTTLGNCYTCPINGITNVAKDKNKPTGYLGWKGKFKGRIIGKDGKNDTSYSMPAFTGETSYANFYKNDEVPLYLEGIKFSSGVQCQPFDIDCELFMDDFPKLAAQYKKLQQILPIVSSGEQQNEEAKELTTELIKNGSVYVNYDEKIQLAKKAIKDLCAGQRKYLEEEFKKVFNPPVVIDDNTKINLNNLCRILNFENLIKSS